MLMVRMLSVAERLHVFSNNGEFFCCFTFPASNLTSQALEGKCFPLLSTLRGMVGGGGGGKGTFYEVVV